MADTTVMLLQDAFGRVRELVVEVTDGLADRVAGFRPDAGANSVAWLVWHLTRVTDDHLAGLCGAGQVWPRFFDDFALPFDLGDTGYGHTSEQVAAVRTPGRLLDGYHREVHAATGAYLDTLGADELARVVDESWDPPVTVAVRLVSVLGDALQHLGQAGYVRGLAERAGVG